MKNKDKFILDRTAFRHVAIEKKDDRLSYWRSKMVGERLTAAWYLTSCA